MTAKAPSKRSAANRPAGNQGHGAPADGDDARGLSEGDLEAIEDRSQLRSPVIYEIVRREGDEEMERPITSLWWSGVAGGLSISFSLLAQGVLQSHLPDAPWRPLVSDFGYCAGFLIAIMARHQLFTETTITAVLPLAAELTIANLGRVARMWGVVLVANIAGTLLAAAFFSFAPAIAPDLRAAMVDVAGQMMSGGPIDMFFRAVGAGFMMATMVWLIPSAQAAKFHVIVLMTYLIAIGGFAHIVAGSMEAWMLVLSGHLDLSTMLVRFAAPVLSGNIVGGTALFALLSYAQVAKEI
jgi:formate/nitrite transporter FocA (FNT family)